MKSFNLTNLICIASMLAMFSCCKPNKAATKCPPTPFLPYGRDTTYVDSTGTTILIENKKGVAIMRHVNYDTLVRGIVTLFLKQEFVSEINSKRDTSYYTDYVVQKATFEKWRVSPVNNAFLTDVMNVEATTETGTVSYLVRGDTMKEFGSSPKNFGHIKPSNEYAYRRAQAELSWQAKQVVRLVVNAIRGTKKMKTVTVSYENWRL